MYWDGTTRDGLTRRDDGRCTTGLAAACVPSLVPARVLPGVGITFGGLHGAQEALKYPQLSLLTYAACVWSACMVL